MALQTNYMNAQPVQQGGLLAARQQRDANTWKQMLDVAKMDTQTAAGFGLGRLLSQWWNRYQEKKNDPNNQAWEAANKQKGEYDSFDAQINDIAGQIAGLQQANDAIDNPAPQYNLANDVQTVGQNLAAQGYQNPADEAFKAKSLPDMAFFDGVKKEKNNQQIESLKARQAELTQKRDAIGQMLAQSGILGPTPQEQAMQQAGVNNRYLSGLLNFQNAYADAQSRGDQAGMDAAHAGAMDWREQGRAAGIDPALLDERLNPQQVQEIMRQNEWGSVFNSMSSDDMYQLTFNRARANGMSFNEAKALAGDAAAKYQAQRVAAMSNATLKYGIGEDGALNAMGVQGIAQLAQISPETANALANMLPGMKDAYAKKTQQELLGLKHGYHQDDMVLGGKIDMAKEDQKHAHDEETANNNVQRALYQAEQMVGINSMAEEAKAVTRARIADYFGLTGDKKQRYITTGRIDAPKGNGNSNGGISATKTAEAQGKMQKALQGYMNGSIDEKELDEQLAELYPLLGDDEDGAREIVEGKKYVRNCRNEIEAGHMEQAAQYYKAFRSNESLASSIPAEKRQEMDDILASQDNEQEQNGNNPSSGGGYAAPEISEETKELARNIESATERNIANNPWDIGKGIESIINQIVNGPSDEKHKKMSAQGRALTGQG